MWKISEPRYLWIPAKSEAKATVWAWYPPMGHEPCAYRLFLGAFDGHPDKTRKPALQIINKLLTSIDSS